MKENKFDELRLFRWGVYILGAIIIAFWLSLGYIGVHFLHKFW